MAREEKKEKIQLCACLKEDTGGIAWSGSVWFGLDGSDTCPQVLLIPADRQAGRQETEEGWLVAGFVVMVVFCEIVFLPMILYRLL